ncbi:SDR family NAD(P)-dependent oxidoreductase [Mycolicibacterium vinylchloridicum]|uniref:SDR family NAD(P)-dependent oxidoreductase n=1 Tax=Mycolicibacterium vinylchloridicum TaxID=2736928 RepID=UPI002D7F3F70|nr:SDR family NAD(P)-dependent oxidoreductase [Mycolicibacterium vinylchloridicum]
MKTLRRRGGKRYPLAGKVVLITGAGRGLGAATANTLARRGAHVVVADIDQLSAQRVVATLAHARGLALECDVTRLDSVHDAVTRTIEEFGGVDVVIANAGIMGRGATLRALEPTEVGQVMSVNVAGVVNTVSAAMESVISRQGQIVLISSVFAFINGAGVIPYAMSKAAVEQLGRGLGVELARHGASAMTAYFSLIDTPMIRTGLDADPHALTLMRALPEFVGQRIRPHTAATAIVDGIEGRKSAVVIPKRWSPIAVLRGVAGPLVDAKLARDAGVQEALARMDNARSAGEFTHSPTSP